MPFKTPIQKWEARHAERKRNVLVLLGMCALLELLIVPLLKKASVHFNWSNSEFLCSAHIFVPILVIAYFMLAVYWQWIKDSLELNQALKESAWE